MIFIGGISQGSKVLQFAGRLLCGFCGRTAGCEVVMTYYYFSFFFIPLFKWNKKFWVKMACCDAVYELNPEVGKAIARGERVDICSSDLRLVQDGKVRYGTMTEMAGADDTGDGNGENASDPNRMRRCPICKQESPGNFKYCPHCGQRLQ